MGPCKTIGAHARTLTNTDYLGLSRTPVDNTLVHTQIRLRTSKLLQRRGSNILLPGIHTCTPYVVPVPDPVTKISIAKYLFRSYVDMRTLSPTPQRMASAHVRSRSCSMYNTLASIVCLCQKHDQESRVARSKPS